MTAPATKAKAKYNAKSYDNVIIRLKKGDKSIVEEFAKAQNKSLNGFVSEAIFEKMQRDKEKANDE